MSAPKLTVKETTCKTALVKSGLPNFDYALNPYRGCEHGCIYCYAPSVLRYKGEKRWGDFVDVRRNMPRILSKEIRSGIDIGKVGIGTVTDPYQPSEDRYEVTRNCLNVLLKKDFPVSIQTKSTLVLRDLNLLKKFSRCEVGFTITSIDERTRREYEPLSSSFEEKLEAIRELSDSGITTWVFLGPIMPYITNREDDLEKLIDELSGNVSYILIDRLRLKRGIWENIESFLREYSPDLIPIYKDILYSKDEYFSEVKLKIIRLCEEYNINYEVLF
ncbi:MAG: radical SAM protein [Halobacteriota archaeon]|nr:radical SAM protein [Halobacteriota archaeon]